ncbi:MAG: hypothetical protein V1664_03255 [Candidatus Uhrbacteria bacterium]
MSQTQSIVVELGNPNPSTVERPEVYHVAVDLAADLSNGLAYGEEEVSKNLKIVKKDFLSALAGLTNGSVDEIISIMAVGYYSDSGGGVKFRGYEEYTRKVTRAVFRKLKPGGFFRLVVAQDVINLATEAIIGAGFTKTDFSLRELEVDNGLSETPWTTEFGKRGLRVLEILARKKQDV